MLRLLKTRGQNRLPQCLRALELGIDLGFDFADDGQVAVDFGDYSSLFSYRRPINLRFDLLTLDHPSVGV